MTEQHTTYFDLHTQGLGYLHRAREITPKRGQPFLAVEISALHGAEDAVQYTRFDTRVSGREAQAIVRELMPAIEAEKRVLVGFKLGDLYAEPFEYQKGEKQGQMGVRLKARLLSIHWAKIDGEYAVRPRSQETETPRCNAA
jgi:Protein of unknown function (DUF3577)